MRLCPGHVRGARERANASHEATTAGSGQEENGPAVPQTRLRTQQQGHRLSKVSI